MSGRKRGEVELVLRGLGDARQVRMMGYLQRCDDVLGDVTRLVADGAMEHVRALKSSPPTLAADIRALDVERAAIERDWQSWRSEIETLERQMQGRENDSGLRNRWYYDAEYARARELDSSFDELEGRVRQLQQRADLVRGHLRAAVHAFQEKREQERLQALAMVADFERKLNSVALPHPLEPVRTLDLEGCAGELLNQSEVYAGLASGLEKLRQLVAAGEHAEVIALHRQLDQDGEALIDAVNGEYESLRKMTGTALEIAETLSDMGFRVDSEIIGRDFREGLRVFTIDTDRGVEFAVVAGDEATEESDGGRRRRVQVRFNVDGLGQQCGHSAKDIEQRLRHRGVDFVITDWGRTDSGGESTANDQSRQKGGSVL